MAFWESLPLALVVLWILRIYVLLSITAVLQRGTHSSLTEGVKVEDPPGVAFRKVGMEKALSSNSTSFVVIHPMLCAQQCYGHETCVGININDVNGGTNCEMTAHLTDTENLEERSGWDHYRMEPLEDCMAYHNLGKRGNGLYLVKPPGFFNPITVYCELEGTNSGWLLLQRRQPAEFHIDFNQSWTEYKEGFGDLDSEFWLGNEIIHKLTTGKPQTMQLRFESFAGTLRKHGYTTFSVGDEDSKYRLTIGPSYSGECMSHLNGMKFSTYDQDNDIYSGDCVHMRGGSGFWHSNCGSVNINGVYMNESDPFVMSAIYIGCFGQTALKSTALLIRPKK